MENIVPIEEFGTFVQECVAEINKGLAASRASGILVEMPESLQVSALVVRRWQPEEFQIIGAKESKEEGLQGGITTETQVGTTTETQGGSTAETQEGDSTETVSSNDQSSKQDASENKHTQKTETETNYTS